MTRRLSFEGYTRGTDQLALTFRIDDLRFTTSYWYSDVRLPDLEMRYGREFMEKIYFHIAAFEINKLASLKPDIIDLGPFRRFHTPAFEALWKTVFRKVWAQWRYENQLPNYLGPAFSAGAFLSSAPAVEIDHGRVPALNFCGGGKDSLVVMKLLERASIPYASCAYSHSIYGGASHQHALIDSLLDCGAPVHRHKQWVFDDFLDSPIVPLHREYGIKTLTAAETPSSVFAVLPLVLQHGYRYIVIGNERSADVGNLIWPATGEDVNHQWGKSLEAELLLGDYIRQELITNISYFSLLKPIYDVLIFNLLRRDLLAVIHTHSCNIRKPWCGECPKCAYVWANYMAYLPIELVQAILPRNLFDVESNLLSFRQMLGLEEHTPFECIGQVPEVRLAFELCYHKGITGRAMEIFKSEVRPFNLTPLLDTYLSVDVENSSIPTDIAAAVLPQFREAVGEAREYVTQILDG